MLQDAVLPESPEAPKELNVTHNHLSRLQVKPKFKICGFGVHCGKCRIQSSNVRNLLFFFLEEAIGRKLCVMTFNSVLSILKV